jgi:hypothetical protein
MAPEPPHYPSPGEITSAANQVVDAAVKMRGEQELRYVPQGDNPWRNIAGRSEREFPEPQAGPYGGFAVGPDGRYLGTDADWAQLRDQYTGIPDLFAHRIDPDPKLFQPLIDGMEQTALSIHDDPKRLETSPVSQYIDDASGKLTKWSGEAAETFRSNFVERLKIAADNQAIIAGVMMNAIIAERDIFVMVRRDLLDLAKNTVHAIEASHDKDPGGIKTVLNVAAAVTGLAAGIASIPTTGGLLLPAGLQAGLWIISGFSATASQAVPSGGDNKKLSVQVNGKTITLGAGSVDGVLSHMIDAISAIDNLIASHERDVVKSLSSCQSALANAGQGGQVNPFTPPPPSLVGDSDSQIHHGFVPP